MELKYRLCRVLEYDNEGNYIGKFYIYKTRDEMTKIIKELFGQKWFTSKRLTFHLWPTIEEEVMVEEQGKDRTRRFRIEMRTHKFLKRLYQHKVLERKERTQKNRFKYKLMEGILDG